MLSSPLAKSVVQRRPTIPEEREGLSALLCASSSSPPPHTRKHTRGRSNPKLETLVFFSTRLPALRDYNEHKQRNELTMNVWRSAETVHKTMAKASGIPEEDDKFFNQAKTSSFVLLLCACGTFSGSVQFWWPEYNKW